MYWSIRKVKALDDYQLELMFENNEVKIFDVKPYLETGLFKMLKDKVFFNRVNVSFDTVGWPNGIDLDPEVLYEDGKTPAAFCVAEERGVYGETNRKIEGIL